MSAEAHAADAEGRGTADNPSAHPQDDHIETFSDSITVLQCEGGYAATKTIRCNGHGELEIQGFRAGMWFHPKVHEVAGVRDLSELLSELERQPDRLVIRGKQITDGERVRRNIYPHDGDPAYFGEHPRCWVLIDFDKIPCDIDPATDPKGAICFLIGILPEPFHGVTVHYQFSSSQGTPQRKGTLSAHLWFWFGRPVTSDELKAYFDTVCPDTVDLSLFNAVQAHYTAAPVVEGMDDPLPRRSGLIEGEQDHVTLPPIEIKERKAKTRPRSERGSVTDYDRAIAVLVEQCPKPGEGKRGDYWAAVGGTLYRGGWDRDEIHELVDHATGEAGDEKAPKRIDSALRLCDAIDAGRPAQGLPTLAKYIPDNLDTLLLWLGVKASTKVKDVTDLLAMEFPELEFIVSLWITEGLTILAGFPKIGKSWLILGIAMAVAKDEPALGTLDVTGGTVLVLALEDNDRRLKRRLKAILQGQPGPMPGRFRYETKWPRLGDGGMEMLRNWLLENPDAKLVVIDTHQKVRSPDKRDSGIYKSDYDAISGLKALADEFEVAITVVHHCRKTPGTDPLEEVSGSTGLTGAADSILVLKKERGQADATLFATGRDIEESEKALQFDTKTGLWSVLGDAGDYRQSQERLEIIRLLEGEGKPMTPKEIAKALGKNGNTIRGLLKKMLEAGTVDTDDDGKYIPSRY